MKQLKLKILPKNLVMMKKQIAKRTIRANSRALALLLSVIAILTCVSVTFAWFGSTFENLNTVITMGNYSADISVYSEKGKLIVSQTAKNGDNVSFDNSDSRYGWSSGDVSCYYIYANNTGDINIKTYLSLASTFVSSASDNNNSFDGAKQHFYYYLKDVTKSAEDEGGLINFAEKNQMPTASYIQHNGKSFANSDSILGGEINKSKNASYALYFCCYDLPDAFVSDNYRFVFNTSIITTQAGTPDGTFVADSSSIERSMLESLKATQGSTNPNENKNSTKATTPSTSVKETQQTTTATTTKETEWQWKYNDSKKNSVCLTSYNGASQNIVLPSAVGNTIITKLDDNLFKNSKVKSVVVPASIKDFGLNTFNVGTLKTLSFQPRTIVNNKVYSSKFMSDSKAIYSADKTALVRYLPQNNAKSFVVPREVTAIYDNAFKDSKTLNEISIYNVNYISTLTFRDCQIKTFNLYGKNPVVATGVNVFGNDEKTTIHTLSSMSNDYKSASSVQDYKVVSDLKSNIYESFDNVQYDGLKYVIIDNNTCYNGVKYECKGYNKIAVVVGYTKIAQDGVVKVPNAITNKNVAYKVAAISDYAFENCKQLKQVVIANNSISYSANSFSGCSNLGIIQYDNVVPFAKTPKETAGLPTEDSTLGTTGITDINTEPAE